MDRTSSGKPVSSANSTNSRLSYSVLNHRTCAPWRATASSSVLPGWRPEAKVRAPARLQWSMCSLTRSAPSRSSSGPSLMWSAVRWSTLSGRLLRCLTSRRRRRTRPGRLGLVHFSLVVMSAPTALANSIIAGATRSAISHRSGISSRSATKPKSSMPFIDTTVTLRPTPSTMAETG